MKIKVTAKHIHDGERYNIGYCPVALALKGRLHKAVAVDDKVLTYYTDGPAQGRRFGKTPRDVRTFLRRFDDRKSVKPFSFNISFTKASGRYMTPWELKCYL